MHALRLVALTALCSFGLQAAPSLPVAYAAPKKAKSVKKLLKKAKKAKKKKQWGKAIASYKAAFEIDPAPGILGKIGRAYAASGDAAAGVSFVEAAIKGISDGDIKAAATKELNKLTAVLKKTHGRLRLRTKPKAAKKANYTLTKGDQVLKGKTPVVLWLEAGKWKLVVEKKGRKRRKKTLKIKAGKFLKKTLKLKKRKKGKKKKKKKKKKGDEASLAASAGTPDEPEGPGINWLAVSVVTTGLAVMGGGVYFGLESGSEQERRDKLGQDGAFLDDIQSADESAKSAALMANVLVPLGVAAMAGGVALFFLDDGEASATASTTRWQLVPQPGGFVWTWGGEL